MQAQPVEYQRGVYNLAYLNGLAEAPSGAEAGKIREPNQQANGLNEFRWSETCSERDASPAEARSAKADEFNLRV